MFLYFTKVVAVIHSLIDKVFSLEEHFQPWIVYIQCIWQIFLFIIWVESALFQDATCRDLVFSMVLRLFEISTCNHPCFQRYWVNLPFQLQFHSTNGSFSIIKEQLQSTAWNMSKYKVISGPYFPVIGLNIGKYWPEITPYLDTFHAVTFFQIYCIFSEQEELQEGDTMVINYDTTLVSGMYKLKDSL